MNQRTRLDELRDDAVAGWQDYYGRIWIVLFSLKIGSADLIVWNALYLTGFILLMVGQAQQTLEMLV